MSFQYTSLHSYTDSGAFFRRDCTNLKKCFFFFFLVIIHLLLFYSSLRSVNEGKANNPSRRNSTPPPAMPSCYLAAGRAANADGQSFLCRSCSSSQSAESAVGGATGNGRTARVLR